ncbi:glycosyltransferase [Hanstruepera ponticola]|uniref:glycosyltransferase n=1 Tax=Hanstruepera ponticola TaxID=2042995 RepID=UPI000CF08D77|nr:glycosyltransferase [Hanstruepera ponticola]
MSKKIRILFTTSNFNTAGSGKVIYDLINGLDKTKFDIEIACGNDEGHYFKVVKSLGLPIHIFKTKTTYRPYHSLLYRILKISRFFRTHQYDIVHSWQWSNDWTEAVAAKFSGAKWLYTKKAMGFKSKHWRIKSYIADFIVTINDEMRDYFPNKNAQALIPLGIDTDYYNPDSFKNQNNNNDSKFKVITVANLVPVKGIEVLIHAIKNLNDSTIQLTVLGDNQTLYAQEIIGLTETLGMSKQVDFIGKQLDVRPYLVSSDLYVIPTLNQGRREGMPMALVEAMSMRVPALGSNISGINFVLKDFKELLFESGDSNALGLKIREMQSIGVEKRKALGERLRVYCKSHYSMETFIASHESLYKKLVNKN